MVWVQVGQSTRCNGFISEVSPFSFLFCKKGACQFIVLDRIENDKGIRGKMT